VLTVDHLRNGITYLIGSDSRNISTGEMAQKIFDFGLVVIYGPLMLLLAYPPDAAFLKRPRLQFPDFIHPPRFSLQLVVQLLRLFLVPRAKRLSNSFP